MRSTKAIVSVLVGSLALVLAAGCGDDDDDVFPGTGGSGGKGGGSSTAGTGGSRAGSGGMASGGRSSGGTAGTSSNSGGAGAGTSTTGGTTSAGGATSGGSSPTGGTAPASGGTTAQQGGSNPGMGGTTVTPAGGAGAGGDGGTAGEGTGGAGGSEPIGGGGAGGEAGSGGSGGGEPEATYCRASCTSESDCKRTNSGEYGFCDTQSGACRPNVLCQSADDCIPAASAWTVRCNDQAACPEAGQVCVQAPTARFERGFCVTPKPVDAECAAVDRTARTLKRWGTQEDVVVCANVGQGCDAGTCRTKSCDENSDCSATLGGTSCNPTIGFCECSADADCGQTGRRHCYTDTKRCGCSTDEECAQTGRIRVCNLNTRACETLVACTDVSACSSSPFTGVACE